GGGPNRGCHGPGRRFPLSLSPPGPGARRRAVPTGRPSFRIRVPLRRVMVKASDLFVRALEAEGVSHVFAVPGEENLDLLESLRGSSIQLVPCRHEQAAGFMAATFGRLTGVP